jgi:3-hydroxyisobutyrate dehydrogenase-like beta-hydroxyacid dehydrogenase
MAMTVAILAPGNMGAAVAQRITASGTRVLTCLEGRSKASRQRAASAGMQDVSLPELVRADLVLSIVPPGEAMATARRLAPLLAGAEPLPTYVDCNAVSPQTVLAIAEVIAPTGCGFIDGGIIGGPPVAGKAGPVFYFSGEAAARALALAECGLDVRDLKGPIGAASGLKMSYAGITKGMTAIASAMMLASERFGAGPALHAELGDSLKPLLAWFERQVPGMYPKAYRWVAEMEEIADFLDADPAAAQMFRGAAALYERLAQGDSETSVLTRFLDQKAGP